MTMKIDRRQFLAATTGGIAVVALGGLPALGAAEMSAEDRIKEFTGGAQAGGDKITLTTPEIAENGNTVPISVEVESAMEGGDLVESIMVLADGNPRPEVVTFNFTAMSGAAAAKTRIRLAKTQNVVAVAKMADGSFRMAKNQVKVTIGGCGG